MLLMCGLAVMMDYSSPLGVIRIQSANMTQKDYSLMYGAGAFNQLLLSKPQGLLVTECQILNILNKTELQKTKRTLLQYHANSSEE